MKSKQILIAILLGGFVTAEDNQLKFSGQVRQRYEMVNKDFSDTTGFNNKNYLRTRFSVSYQSEDVTTFVQLQDSRIFGTETSTLKDGTADALDVHQAYFKLNNLFGMSLNAKVGRFEAVYGPQRLIGSVGWHNIGRSFDGIVFNYTTNFANVDFFNYKQVEAGTFEESDDFNVRGAYANLNLMKGHKTQAFAIQDNKRMTLGGYGKGAFGVVSYEMEFAIQNGNVSDDIKAGGLMYGINAGYKISGMTLSAGIDFISGDDPETADKNEAFNTLYATNHKYYGFMDYFLNLPVHTGGLGLQDIHVKLNGFKFSGHVINVAYHMFNADKSSDSFGNELDITLVKKFADNVKFVAGYSMFMPGKLKAENGENGNFVYLMTIVNF
ncbi:MAG: alginate export family protein [Candidatus Marinimicrobia bacterium]|nr:alginate export family protein [Candidatus Neomarinimicrobiota bacterium]